MKISRLTLAIILVLLFINLKGLAFANTLYLPDYSNNIFHADLYDSNTYQSIDIHHVGWVNIYGGTFTGINSDRGSVNIYGGSVNEFVGIDDGDVNLYNGTVNSMLLHNYYISNMFDGTINSMTIDGYSYFNMFDGIVNNLYTQSTISYLVNIYDGYIGNAFIGYDSGVSIYGGHINTINLLQNFSRAYIYGGIIDNLLYPAGDWVLSHTHYELYGYDFKYIYEDTTPTRLEGFLLDGSPLDISLGDTTDLSYKIVLHNGIPEPTTILLLGSGLIGLAGYGRKKFFKK